ncbi:MAG: hypothetical protein ACI4D7_01815 [Lachnospiraceae bacterium]
MLKLLLKKQMTEIFRNYFYDSKKNRARSKAGLILYIIFFLGIMVGVLGGMFAYLSMTLCGPLAAVGMDWLYFCLMGLMAVLLGTFGSVFNASSCLYLSKDNDLMLSLPIPVNVLMASRLLTLYLMGLMYSIVVIIPAVVVYWITVSASIPVIFGCLLLILLISIFILTLSCILGWVVARISLKLKNKSLISVLVSLIFFGGYYFFYFKAQELIQDLLVNAVDYGVKIKGAAYPLYLFGRVGIGDPMAMCAVTAVILVLFALVWSVISHSFLKIATSSGRTARRIYKEKNMKQRSIFSALLSKEFGRFLSSPVYMLNCGLGVLLLPVGGIILLFKSSTVISVLNDVFGERVGCTPLLLCAVVCVLASMNNMAAPSISLEGKSFWLVQSLPVKPWQVLQAKLSVQILLTGVPVCFCLFCLAMIYPWSGAELVLAAFALLVYVLFSALFDLSLGLLMPNLNWTNEITPIKESIVTVISMISGFAYTVLFCVGYMLLDGWKLGFAGYMALVGAVTLVLSILLLLWLRKKGCSQLISL